MSRMHRKRGKRRDRRGIVREKKKRTPLLIVANPYLLSPHPGVDPWWLSPPWLEEDKK